MNFTQKCCDYYFYRNYLDRIYGLLEQSGHESMPIKYWITVVDQVWFGRTKIEH